MVRDGDAALIEAIGNGLESGQLSLHVHYRRARKTDGFREALVAQVGSRAVLIRDKFMGTGLTALLIWFLVAEGLDLHEQKVRVLGSPMSVGFLTFALLLIVIVMAYRKFIKPVQGGPMRHAALSSPELFLNLWQSGALALMTRSGRDRICQSPKGDWRAFAQRALASGE